LKFNDKNILILTNHYPDKENIYYGGIFVKEQVKYLKDYFKEVYVISPQALGINRKLRDYEYDNVKVFFPRFLHIPINYFRRRLGDNFFKNALRVIERENLEFDLIHAHFTWPSGYAGALLRKMLKVPLIITAHGFDVYEVPFQNKYYRKKVLFALETANHVITVSGSNLRILTEKLGLPKGRVSLIPNGFDGKLFRTIPQDKVRLSLGIPSEKKIILTVGNLVPGKGHEYLIKAARKVIEKRIDVLFVIVGSGPLRKKLESLMRSLNLENYFYFAGARPHDEIPLWMNASDLFVLPSLRESFGVVQIEAMACGVPVVATRNGGSEEIITSEDYGLLCPSADPECLAEKILIALEKEWDKEKIRKYAEQFRWENIVKQILVVYREVLNDESYNNCYG